MGRMDSAVAPKKQSYGNESITSLKGADRVRKRPAVIFGSDGLEGCEHAVFEILSNSIDEAREGHGSKIVTTRFEDGSIEVQDFRPGHAGGLQSQGTAFQLGADLLRIVCRRQIQY